MDITLLGTGLLGAAIGERLLQRGHRLTVWNRSPERTAPLVAAGAHAAGSPAEAAAASSWLITVLSDGEATRSVLIEGIGTTLQGRTVLQTGTIAPGQSRDLARQVEERGGRYLETPVLGSRPEALAGRLQVMVGGSEERFALARPLLEELSEQPRWLGGVGAGMVTKLALNQLIASLTHAFSLSLRLVEAAGVDEEAFLEILRGSALHAPTFDKKLARMRSDDYSHPNFPTAHLRKDLNLFLEAAERHGLEILGLRGLGQLLEQATPAGIDSLDYSALHRLTGPAGTSDR
jgi:3-hydroxyisobutyrate dehydrogenase